MTTEQFSVARKTVIVTGSSQGIGRTIARQFAADGANVVVTSRDESKVETIAAEIADETTDGEAIAVECDVTNRDEVDALVEATVEAFGTVDVLINNAGASFMADFDEISENGWRTIVDINLHGTFHCTQAVGPVMRENGGGVVINVSSTAGQKGSPRMTHYSAAKAGVITLTSTLAYEWAEDDIRVNCIAPGFVATPGVASQMGVDVDDVDRDSVSRRMGTPEEIADLAQFLASPASSYLVGETVTAKGVPRIEETHEV
ncbi:SDR family NAD(P)-dependent oxidoreductase [Natrinema caseinilyticum]|uniref:SDR family NAD(P)-dependent oxidoreductase n=1 Tax=Natrinema caseinilyticum TaxID=2961570 RepID=UPI0020C20917|nr:SDR family NAD(P)-dependent oxidoreductase [Natrinema caseinilyticum]